jgi:hypoxanthine phosphoribosyltransferase
MNTPASTEKDLWVSWDEYNRLVERLALQVYESNWKFDMVLCLARGGVRPGDVISRIFDVPLAILSTSSYREEAGTKQGNLDIAKYMTMTKGPLAGRILLVDDLADSGVTLQGARAPDRELCRRHRSRSAVIWVKGTSAFRRTTTWKTCRTTRGSTSRSRITTACVRTSCRRG